MRKALMIVVNTMILVSIAAVAFAEGGMATELTVAIAYASAFGMGFAAALCGLGQGLGVKAACEGVARNPEASGKMTTTLLLGLAFIESLAIYALVISLILLFVF